MPLRSTHFTPACVAFIKQWQGLSLEKYQDKNGVWVIGYGHEIAAEETFDTPITLMQAESLLLADLHLCEAFIHEKKPQIKDRFQLEALITWIFSVGITRFSATEIWPVAISQPEVF
ncbi:TPA: lysozyme [Citrobacter werkmanii]